MSSILPFPCDHDICECGVSRSGHRGGGPGLGCDAFVLAYRCDICQKLQDNPGMTQREAINASIAESMAAIEVAATVKDGL